MRELFLTAEQEARIEAAFGHVPVIVYGRRAAFLALAIGARVPVVGDQCDLSRRALLADMAPLLDPRAADVPPAARTGADATQCFRLLNATMGAVIRFL